MKLCQLLISQGQQALDVCKLRLELPDTTVQVIRFLPRTLPRLADKQESRRDFTTSMAREFNCDGIVGEKMVFCDMWDIENYLLDADLKEEGIPFLKVEREYITSGTGQLKTRVQAFIESMGK